MSESEIRRLMPPDDGLSGDRHDLIKERVMASIKSEEGAGSQPIEHPKRFRRRLVPALASVLILAAAGTGAAAALGLFPEQSETMLEEMGCRTAGSVEQLVATADAPNGGSHQFWITRNSGDGPANGIILVELDEGGEHQGGMIGCDEPGADIADSYGEVWAVVPSSTSEDGSLGSVMGHVPPEAVRAIVAFGDGTSVEIEVQDGGYFLGLVFRSDIRSSETESGPDWPEVVHISAVDQDGIVIAERNLN